MQWRGPTGVKEDGGGCTRGRGRVGPMLIHRAACNRDKDGAQQGLRIPEALTSAVLDRGSGRQSHRRQVPGFLSSPPARHASGQLVPSWQQQLEHPVLSALTSLPACSNCDGCGGGARCERGGGSRQYPAALCLLRGLAGGVRGGASLVPPLQGLAPAAVCYRRCCHFFVLIHFSTLQPNPACPAAASCC